ncbi:helix-turn-helix domain-containing protein [Longimycelium tulufanense]|nr:helix-turn-helix transcriptional regulator [Longimycelium tulufanense]
MGTEEREPHHWPLGEKLEAARKRAGYSMREAAEHAGFSVTTWSAIESGYRGAKREPANPEPANIVAAARVVGLDPREALRLGGKDPDRYLPTPHRGRPTVSQRSLANMISQLTEEQRQALQVIVEGMLNTEGPDARPAAGPREVTERRLSTGPQEEVYEEKVSRKPQPRRNARS